MQRQTLASLPELSPGVGAETAHRHRCVDAQRSIPVVAGLGEPDVQQTRMLYGSTEPRKPRAQFLCRLEPWELPLQDPHARHAPWAEPSAPATGVPHPPPTLLSDLGRWPASCAWTRSPSSRSSL